MGSTPPDSTRTDRLLIVSRGAARMTDAVDARLRDLFRDHRLVDFDPSLELRDLLTEEATVIVAGGDGTIGFVLRALAGTDHRVGILPLGTFNNFARSLALPSAVEAAAEIVRDGQVTPITLGIVNGRPFLEVAALGLFGEALALGEALKELRFGELRDHFLDVSVARQFRYRLTGDLPRSGTALSLVFSNTRTTGVGLELGDATPEQPDLELSVRVGQSRADLLRRALAGALPRAWRRPVPERNPRFQRIAVRTRPLVPVYADNEPIGRTPAVVEAMPAAANVILGRGAARGGDDGDHENAKGRVLSRRETRPSCGGRESSD